MVLIKNYIESFSYGEPLSRDEKIERARKHFFDFDYPFFDESKRPEFERRLIKHFYMRESVETIGLTKFRLEDYLNLNMDYWNRMFESELMEFPIFEDFAFNVSEKGNTLKDSQSDTNMDRNKEGSVDTDSTNNKNSSVDTDVVKNKSGLSDTGTVKENKNNQTQSADEKTDNKRTNNNTTDEDNFHRNVFADTPQSNLEIAANGDGTGVINTATTLEEDKHKNGTKSNGTQVDDNKRVNNTTTNGTENGTENVNTLTEEDQTENVDTVTVEDEKRKVGTATNEKENQFLNTDTIENIDKINEKIFKGKRGRTEYADLLRKYRSTFMRIEKMIFNEINKEGIFLLVYGGR